MIITSPAMVLQGMFEAQCVNILRSNRQVKFSNLKTCCQLGKGQKKFKNEKSQLNPENICLPE